MTQVTLRINGHSHTIGCTDGEERHLIAMADEVEKRIDKAKALGVQSGESRLLVMAALLMADELHDLQLELEAVRRGQPGTPDRAKSERLARLAARAEEIALQAEHH
jgi:cell division protein ZapA